MVMVQVKRFKAVLCYVTLKIKARHHWENKIKYLCKNYNHYVWVQPRRVMQIKNKSLQTHMAHRSRGRGAGYRTQARREWKPREMKAVFGSGIDGEFANLGDFCT